MVYSFAKSIVFSGLGSEGPVLQQELAIANSEYDNAWNYPANATEYLSLYK
jgi:hypothetical protein